MRTVILANNRLGMRVATYLAGREELAGAVLHPAARRRHVDGIADLLDGPVVTWPDAYGEIAALEPECVFSVLFGYKLDERWLRLPSWRPVNLHPGLLPWNRGSAPNVWPLVDGSPAGTSLHVMTAGIDEGDVLAQREVAVTAGDTAASLYERLEDASMALVEDVWPRVQELEPVAQRGAGSVHRLADLETLDLLPHELPVLDKMRARTFAPHGAEFEREGRRWRVRVEIETIG